MKRLFLENSANEETRIMQIQNEDGRTLYSVLAGKALPTRKKRLILDADGEKIGDITKIRNSFGLVDLPKYHLKVKNFTEIIFSKEMKSFESFYEITGEEIALNGNWLGDRFELLKNDLVLSRIERQSNHYTIEIVDDSLQELIISVLFCISWIHSAELITTSQI